MSMARLTFPSRLELKRRAGSFSEAPLANVILTTFLYVSPVQTMPPCDQTGVPGFVGFTHFHSSTISGSAAWMIPRTFASIFPRQSPSSLILWSINAEADSMAPALATNLVALCITCNFHASPPSGTSGFDKLVSEWQARSWRKPTPRQIECKRYDLFAACCTRLRLWSSALRAESPVDLR